MAKVTISAELWYATKLHRTAMTGFPVDNPVACQSSAKSRYPQQRANPAKSAISPCAAPELVMKQSSKRT
eukprot:6917595-Prymnesium_polylepis.1